MGGIHETEKGFLQALRDLAKVYGWKEYHTFSSLRSPQGFPDLVLVHAQSCLFVEVKTDRGRLSPAQQEWLAALRQCPGVETYVWRPQDWATIVKRLKVL